MAPRSGGAGKRISGQPRSDWDLFFARSFHSITFLSFFSSPRWKTRHRIFQRVHYSKLTVRRSFIFIPIFLSSRCIHEFIRNLLRFPLFRIFVVNAVNIISNNLIHESYWRIKLFSKPFESFFEIFGSCVFAWKWNFIRRINFELNLFKNSLFP